MIRQAYDLCAMFDDPRTNKLDGCACVGNVVLDFKLKHGLFL